MSRASRLLEGARHITAVLGPTNTGKTHRAIQRMLHHDTAMIGLPLRLLAREVYDRLVAARGEAAVALVTGEEKILPKTARYFVCTVEAMPLDRPVAFLVVDEIQLAGDPNRGHVFTDRLLHARGVLETMFLGADTIAPLLQRLVPDARIERQPRYSELSHTGSVRLAALPRRSAAVAFGVEHVYELAEQVRALHGGTAVVLGALSPRTRNAQVAMYQAGEVAHLVATDAIGMGLNLDLHHVAFAGLRKFDGRTVRDLRAPEIAQIAGRAGRYTTDGTFGTLKGVGPLDPAVVQAVEQHSFPPLTRLYWRNSALDTRSPQALLASLRQPAPHPALVLARDEEDERALEALVERGGLRLDHPEAIELLWEVCRIPDFRKTLTGSHVELLHRIAGHLLTEGRLPDDWVAKRVGGLDVVQGDIDALMARIAYVRTWTYVAHQRGWLADPVHWQQRTRAIEDRLSDALHERLTQRFVDRRAMVLTGGVPAIEVEGGVVRAATPAGEAVLGHLVGLDLAVVGGSRRLHAAVARGLKGEIAARVQALVEGPDEAIAFDPRHRMVWEDGVVGWVSAGPSPLEPQVTAARLELLDPGQREEVRRRLVSRVEARIDALLAPLRGPGARGLRGAPRGLLYALQQGMGVVDRDEVRPQIEALTREEQKGLARLGVRLGAEVVYVRSMLRPASMAQAAWLWSVHQGEEVHMAPPGAPPAVPASYGERGLLRACGYRILGDVAIRADILERVAARIRTLARSRRPAPLDEVMSWLGVGRHELDGVVAALGFRWVSRDGRLLVIRARRRSA